MKSKLPEHVDCNNTEIVVCEYYMDSRCLETCAYALDIRGLGIGAIDQGIVKVIQDEKESLGVACCPLFFTQNCGVEMTKKTYNKLCLNNYQDCEIYNNNGE